MKIKNYLNLPVLLLLAATFFSVSSVANAADVHALCLQGNKNACSIVKDIQQSYEQKKMLVLWEHLKNLENIQYELPIIDPPVLCDPRFCDPPLDDIDGELPIIDLPVFCDPRFCDPFPIFIDALPISPIERREILIDLVNNLDKEIESLDKFN